MGKTIRLPSCRNKLLSERIVFAIISLLMLWCFGSRVNSAERSTDQYTWVFKQKQYKSGFHTLYFTPNAVKIVCETQGYTLVCKAPLWKLYCYRPDDRVYRMGILQDFYNDYPYNPKLAKDANQHFLKHRTYQVEGLTVTDYSANNHFANYRIALVVKPAVSSPVSDLILAYYRMFPATGILYREHLDVLKEPQAKLSSWNNVVGDEGSGDAVVTSSVKRIPYLSSDFEMPKGYRLAKDWQQLYLSDSQRKRAADLVDDLDLGGTAKKR